MTKELAKDLLDHLIGGGKTSRLSVIGLSKNAGKTVTLNHLIRAAAERNLTLGLVSTGRDGEEQDAITELPKPRIWAPTGSWVATAKHALPACNAQITPFHDLPMKTPFGPMLIGRVERGGDVLLIGPGSAKRMGEVLGGLEAHGARLSMVDGSFDRIAAAAPEVTGRVVLAAGAAYSANMAETVAQVQHVLDIFDLPKVFPAVEGPVEFAALRSQVSVVTLSGAITEVPVESALGDPEPIVAAALAKQDYGAYIVLNGALGDRLLMTILKHRMRTVGLVVADPTHVLVERNLWRRWRRQGGEVFVRRPIQVRAITTNAHSPVGQDYDPGEFFEAIRTTANRPVYDLQEGLGS